MNNNEVNTGKSRIKRILACILCVAVLCSVIPAPAFAANEWDWLFNGKNNDTESEEPVPGPFGIVPREDPVPEFPEELIVGHTTETKGDFFTEMFGNNTADIDVRALLHGYNLVDWDQNQGTYVINPDVVTGIQVSEDADGNHSYFMELSDDLYYSDGTQITAWDYAFSMLLMMAPEIEQIGGKIYRAEHILGYDRYIRGQARNLEGVEVPDDFTLVITLDADFLPYFFEVGLLLCVPYPISVIAPGCRVYDNGTGCFIANADNPNAGQPIFTAELLRRTILDPETGYNSHPSVVSGPYMMTSYDGVTAHFELNPYYKRKPIVITKVIEPEEDEEEPSEEKKREEEKEEEKEPETVEIIIDENNPGYIKKIQFTLADNDTLVQKLKDGELHLVDKLTYGPVIQELMRTAGENDLRFQNEPRIGLSFLTFTYDRPAVHEKAVRQAIAWCMDRDRLTQDYCAGFGLRVDGYYGVGQWEYMTVNGQIDYPVVMADGTLYNNIAGFPNRVARTDAEYEQMIEAWEDLSLDELTEYKVDTLRAEQILISAGWVLNRQGNWFNPAVDDVRCKYIDNQLVALDLTMMYPEGNHIVDTLQENFIENLKKVGIKLTPVPTPMEDLLLSYYREAPRTTDMIYLATNFHVVVDPSITYSADDEALHLLWNNTYSDDRKLYDLAVDMRKTEPGDIFTYVQKWIRFQERYNEVLPAIPIYSNIYFDFFTNQLQNYSIPGHVTWSQAILESYFGLEEEEPAEEEPAASGQAEGDLIEFED
ncbi:MAG: hypothetical protein IJ237_11025 [Oscillospiraceae bacterium]|nr:hypothetical protein [Oscillospiraceae bacterium]